MRDLFPEYYRPTDDEFNTLWEEGLFVLDTNVLLNLYRFPEGAREDLFKIVNHLGNRVWLPHQVALEYQENRLDVIREQYKRFDQVRGILNDTLSDLQRNLKKLQLDKRHSKIDPSDLLNEVDRLFEDFKTQLEEQQDSQPAVQDTDEIREQIDSYFEGCVGAPPNEEQLAEWQKEGEDRYANEIPPGYLDDKEGTYPYLSLSVERKYGDLVLWKQILQEAAAREDLKGVVFITDDNKEDWWLRKSGKTLGPRRELAQEMRSEAGVGLFHMYDTSRLIKFAAERFDLNIRETSSKEAEEVSDAISDALSKLVEKESSLDDLFAKYAATGRRAFTLPNSASRFKSIPYPYPAVVDEWVKSQYPGYEMEKPPVSSPFSYVLNGPNGVIGVIEWYFEPGEVAEVVQKIESVLGYLEKQEVDRAHFVVAAQNKELLDLVYSVVPFRAALSDGLRITAGSFVTDSEGTVRFEPDTDGLR